MAQQPINVIIVDDEPLALDIMETFVKSQPQLHLVARCNSALEANQVIREQEVDLMFLDIQMPMLTGIDFVKTLSKPPLVVFTTAYANYAVEGFELNAVDYLLKPISLDRFIKAVNKAQELLELQRKQDLSEAAQIDNEQSGPDYFFVKADKKMVKINFKDIIYVEGLKDYVIIRMDAQRIVTLQTMKSLEERLPSDQFLRIHRSYIVNIDRINAVIGNMVEVVEKGQPKHIPVGKNHRDELQVVIDKFKL